MGDYVSLWLEVLSGVPQGSVLCPILFIIFINELADIIKHPSKLYADDTKILARIATHQDRGNLQINIDNVVEWCRDWHMQLNVEKCKIMHIGKHNQNYSYDMSTVDNTRTELRPTCIERDLGVMISANLKLHDHTIYAANKANRMLGMLRKTFSHFNTELLKILYTTFVRPHLEFAVSACNPYATGDIELLEKVQHRATRLVRSLREISYPERLEVLGLTTLEKRRVRGDLIQTFKILNGIDDVMWCTPSSFETRHEAYLTRGHSFKLTRELVKNCDQRHHFFTNRVVNNWNSLPIGVVTAPSVNSFKARLDREMQTYPDIYV